MFLKAMKDMSCLKDCFTRKLPLKGGMNINFVTSLGQVDQVQEARARTVLKESLRLETEDR
jgi:hypothetical protein